MSGPEVITLGCRLNVAESAAMRALAAGLDNLVIVNSCAVTNEAVSQTRQAIRRAKRARPDARVVVTGCAAQVEPDSFAAMPEVDRVVGNAEKLFPSSFQPKLETLFPFPRKGSEFPASAGMTGEALVSDIFAVRETAPHLASAFVARSRAFVEVQTGCDHRCTFCIIPYGRGNSRSVPAGAVVEAVQAQVDQGCQEVVLTGVDVTSYGPDLPGAPSLGSLVERILKHVPSLPRLRLSSIDCIEIDDRLFDLVTGEKRVMPHLHLSLQAGDDMVLKRMKRRHSRAQAAALVERLKARRPEIAIGADLIAGFPTETDAMHANSLELIEECDVVMGHIFPYSPKRGTPAARMPQVAGDVVKARARALREAAAARKAAWLQDMVPTRQRVLVERGGSGHAENFAPVRLQAQPLPSPSSRRRPGSGASGHILGVHSAEIPASAGMTVEPVGQIIEVQVTGFENNILIGTPA